MEDAREFWTSLYVQHHAYLMSVAFRMVGSLAEAEELVHDTFLDGQERLPRDICSPRAWLTRVCTNKVINHLKSASKRREVYPGVWLPDAIPEGLSHWESSGERICPEKRVLMAESLTVSFLVLLEKLTPEQRIVYLLSEVFEYSFSEIAGFLGKEVASCRKIAQRARQAIADNPVRFSSPPENAKEIISKLYAYARRGDREGLRAALAKDSELWGDGGGRVFASGLITDVESAVEFLYKLGTTKLLRSNMYRMEYRSVSFRPGLVVSRLQPSGTWTLDSVLSYEFHGDKVARIYAQRNPEKLEALLPSRPSVPKWHQ